LILVRVILITKVSGENVDKLAKILHAAEVRASEKGLSYAGALTPNEAYDLMQLDKSMVLVDVRSRAELELVGRIPVAKHIEWAFYPGMVSNPDFATQLQDTISKNLTLVFICRTGARSHNAALLAQSLGYKAYNMLEGFEGEANAEKQRTLINGWKHAGLPWSN
jgi:rhodanese-related sulfurtransferase